MNKAQNCLPIFKQRIGNWEIGRQKCLNTETKLLHYLPEKIYAISCKKYQNILPKKKLHQYILVFLHEIA